MTKIFCNKILCVYNAWINTMYPIVSIECQCGDDIIIDEKGKCTNYIQTTRKERR